MPVDGEVRPELDPKPVRAGPKVGLGGIEGRLEEEGMYGRCPIDVGGDEDNPGFRSLV